MPEDITHPSDEGRRAPAKSKALPKKAHAKDYLDKGVISHPADLVKELKARPEAFVSVAEAIVKTKSQHGVSTKVKGPPRYQFIQPGSFDKDYLCLGVTEDCFVLLRNTGEIQKDEKGRWKLSATAPR